MNYRALIFDMDGTLVHNMPHHNKALVSAIQEAGIPLPLDLNAFYNSTYGRKTPEVFRALLGPEAGDADVTYWSERKEILYREEFARHRKTLPGLLAFLGQAKALNLPMAVASAAHPENISFVLDELHLRPYFNVVLSGQDVQHGKPNPEIFLKAAAHLGVDPSACLVFEDGLHGVESARRAHMQAVFLTTTMEAREVAGQPNVICAVPDFTHLDLGTLLGTREVRTSA